jgi:hypothetical protein
MEIRLRRVQELLNLIVHKHGVIPNEDMEELSELLRTARLESDHLTLQEAAETLRVLTADDTPVRYERCLGRLDEMLNEVEAELQRIEAEPPDLTELERKGLAHNQRQRPATHPRATDHADQLGERC